eukprot:3009205-Pyramimonas_sp.AAC.1
MTRARLNSRDALQRRILRNIVGWTRLAAERWEDTMRRMRLKLETAFAKFPMDAWRVQMLRR